MENSSAIPADFISSTVKFWLYIIILIPSIICSLFVLYYLLSDRTLRRALNNHVIIVLLFICLICQVTMYPWMLYFYSNGNIWHRTVEFCIIWGFIDWGLYLTQVIVLAWASIERYILIFHDRWISTKKRRFFVHYLPLTLLIFYCFSFYSIVYFFPFCKNIVDDFNVPCVYNCLYDIYAFYMWETIVHQLLPNLIIVVFSIALLLRVLWQKYRINQTIHWRKHRKMTIQLLSISFLYLIFSFPHILITFIHLCALSNDIAPNLRSYANLFSYYIILLFPFVCMLALPELRSKIKKFGRLQRHVRFISPEVFTIKNNPNPRILQNNVQ